MGDLWSPAGEQCPPSGENGGRAQLAPTGAVRFGDVGATCGRPRACKARPDRRKRRASAARPYRSGPVRECRGDLWSPAGEQCPPSGENGGRAQLAPTGAVRFGDVGATCGRPRACKARPDRRKRRASAARPYRSGPVRECRGDLWSPAGEQCPPSGENGGRAQLAPTGAVRFEDVGATCGRPEACRARPDRRKRRASTTRPYRWRPVRRCRGDLWSPVGVQSTHRHGIPYRQLHQAPRDQLVPGRFL